MKIILALFALTVAVAARPQDSYNPRYDNFDAQELVDNVRLLKAYGNCFLGKGPCTPEGSDFKNIIPEALKTSCAKCTPKQRELVRTVVKGFQTKLPKLWKELVHKQDPEGQYNDALNKFLNGN